MTDEYLEPRHCGCGAEIFWDPQSQDFYHFRRYLDRHHKAELQLAFDDLIPKEDNT